MEDKESKLLLLEQEFKNYREATEKEVAELKRIIIDQEKRISKWLFLYHNKKV